MTVPGSPSGPIQVMHLINQFRVGGMEVGVSKLVNALEGRRITSSICSCSPGDSLKERLRPEVRLYELNKREGNDPRLIWHLYRLMKADRPDIVHTHQWGTLCEGVLAARLAGVPAVVHGEHGTLQTRRRNVFVQRLIWSTADQVLSVSSRLADRMASEIGFARDRITVIRNGVDTNRFAPGRRAAARAALGILQDDLVIGAVGRLVSVKDYPNLLRALAHLRDRGIRFRAVIAGTGPLRQELEAMATTLSLGMVEFLGNRDDVPQLLSALDIFVLSSASEGLSNTIQEAMATGVPVVATRVGGADELVDDGETGVLVPARDSGALANGIAILAGDAARRESMGTAGRRKVESTFALDRMIGEYERLYVSLASAASPRLDEVRVNGTQ